MKAILSSIILSSSLFLNAHAQQDTVITINEPTIPNSKLERVYKIKPVIDFPLIAVAGGFSGFAFTKIYSKDPSTEQQIMDLDKKNIPSFDRWAAGMSDENAAATSDIFFYGSIPVPFALLLDKKIRRDGARVGLLYLEAMSITGMFYTGTVFFVDRYRPETYNTDLEVKDRTSGNYKDAFMAGHPALVATATFFTAKVYSDYNPESNFKYVLYGVAIAATGTTVYLRHAAGKHFPSDLLVGTTIGTLSGILVPHFHKNKPVKERSVGFMPIYNGKMGGFAMTYKFK